MDSTCSFFFITITSSIDTSLELSTKEKSFVCLDSLECKFRTSDPASLCRHRKNLHGYVPHKKHHKKPKHILGVNPSDVYTWVRLRKSKAPTAGQNHDNWQQPEGPERVGGFQRCIYLNQLDEDDRDSTDSLVSSDQLYSNSWRLQAPVQPS